MEATTPPLVCFACAPYPVFLISPFFCVFVSSLLPHFFLHPIFPFLNLSSPYSPPRSLPPAPTTCKLLMLAALSSLALNPRSPSISRLLSLLTYSLYCRTVYIYGTLHCSGSQSWALGHVQRRLFSFQLSNQGIILHLVNAINFEVG